MREKHPVLFAYSWLAGFAIFASLWCGASTFLNVSLFALVAFSLAAIYDMLMEAE